MRLCSFGLGSASVLSRRQGAVITPPPYFAGVEVRAPYSISTTLTERIVGVASHRKTTTATVVCVEATVVFSSCNSD